MSFSTKLQMRRSYCVVKTDIETATQEKVASITLDGGYYGMAVWDDAVDLYLQENTAEGERPSLRYIH